MLAIATATLGGAPHFMIAARRRDSYTMCKDFIVNFEMVEFRVGDPLSTYAPLGAAPRFTVAPRRRNSYVICEYFFDNSKMVDFRFCDSLNTHTLAISVWVRRGDFEKRHKLFSRGRAKLRFAEALRSMAFVSQPPEIACQSA